MTQARVIDPEIYGEGADALGHDAMLELSLNMADTALSDLEKLIEADGDEAHRLLHGLKGAASSCGATRLATMAEQKMRSLPLSPADVDELRRIVSLTRDAYSAMIEG